MSTRNLSTEEYLKQCDTRMKYMLLGRMQSDCEYYLGYGDRNAKNLWGCNEESHIKYMVLLYNILDVKPEWLSKEEIVHYGLEMTGRDVSKEFVSE